MLKRWRNAQRRPARRPGVYSDGISLDASNSPTNSKFFCQRIGFFLTFSMAEFRGTKPAGGVASNSPHQTGIATAETEP
jgi:hypothetical protein